MAKNKYKENPSLAAHFRHSVSQEIFGAMSQSFLPLELRMPAGLGVSGRRWILQSMGISFVVGGLYS